MESRFLLNHHHMIIQYHQTEDGNRIVGFYVQPVSVRHTVEGAWNDEHPPVLTSCPEETGLVSSSNPMLITGPNSPKKVRTTHSAVLGCMLMLLSAPALSGVGHLVLRCELGAQ